jgi:hypothetical protein
MYINVSVYTYTYIHTFVYNLNIYKYECIHRYIAYIHIYIYTSWGMAMTERLCTERMIAYTKYMIMFNKQKTP